jgi:aminopeptidase YwaD
MYRLIIILSAVLFFKTGINAQYNECAGDIIKTLSSPEYHGRGYVNDGLAVSAKFIVEEFRKYNLQPLFDGYRQQFTLPVNTFPGKMSVSVNNIPLEPVKEFVVDPASEGLSGNFPVVEIDGNELLHPKIINRKLRKAKGRFLAIDLRSVCDMNDDDKKFAGDLIRILRYDPRLKIAGILELTNEKLSWGASTFNASRPSIMINPLSKPDRIKDVKVEIENKYFDHYPVSNLAGFIRGSLKPDSFILFTAHYDHLGQMGSEAYFPGANDNASGVALILCLAEYFSGHTTEYSMIFVAFAGEEAGLLGSKYFVENSPVELGKIKFLINIDLAGNGEDGITVVNGSVYSTAFDRLNHINDSCHCLPVIKSRGEACNSDHCYFHEAGVPCFFIYTMGGTHAYHDLNDNFSSLTLNKFSELVRILVDFTNSF